MTEDRELGAMQSILAALNPLDEDARARVITYITNRLEIEARPAARVGGQTVDEPEVNGTEPEAATPQTFNSFAELFDAAGPSTNPNKALVAGYWRFVRTQDTLRRTSRTKN